MSQVNGRAGSIVSAGAWDTAAAVTTVTLAHDDRHRRRIVLATDDGGRVLLDLADAVVLNHGDGLVLDDGGIVGVVAATEDVADILCTDGRHLARVVWHLGNRHLPVEVLEGLAVRIGWDHVIADMAKGLGATVERKMAPFHPESGAYSGGGHGHGGHGHGHGGQDHSGRHNHGASHAYHL